MRDKIPAGAKQIIYALNDQGYRGYLVGGCVRDLIMGRQPHDWDICTSATPGQMKKCFVGLKTIDTGLQHGTITVCLQDGSYEVTTFRIDGSYSDGRHPDDVQFTTNLVADLARRDFTINAIAMTAGGIICDPYGGEHDICAKVIRCVGNPAERFSEDGLRIMRALRFASILGFGIDVETLGAIHDCKENLRHIASERIMSELKKLVVGKRPGFTLHPFHDVLSVFWPEIEACVGFDQKSRYHIYDVWSHITQAMDAADSDDMIVRMSLLLHDIAKPNCFTEDEVGYGHFYGHPPVCAKMANDMLRRLKFDNATRELVVQLIEHHDATVAPTPKSVRRWLNILGEDQLRRLLSIKLGDCLTHNPETIGKRLDDIYHAREILDDVILEQQCFSLKDLAINGHDVINAGVREGVQVGLVLKKILQLVIDGELRNDRELLLQSIMSIETTIV